MAVTLSGPSHRVDFPVPTQEVPRYDLRMDVEQDQFATPEHLPNGAPLVVLLRTIGRHKDNEYSHSAISFCYLNKLADITEPKFNFFVKCGSIGRLQIQDNKIISVSFGHTAIEAMKELKIREFMLKFNENYFALDHRPGFSKIPDETQYNAFCSKILAAGKKTGLIK